MDTTEKIIYSSLILASLALGALLCSAFLTLILKQNKILKAQLQSISRVVQGVEDERRRIARNLHDDLGPVLSSLKTAVNRFRLTHNEDIENLRLANAYFEYAIENIRTLSTELTPASLLLTGLVPAIRDFINLINLDSTMKFYFVHFGDIKASKDKEMHIYRLLQESLWNAKKHSGATELLLRMRMEKNFLVIEMQDDGKGFDFHKVCKNSRGIGLASISNRLKILGGRMDVAASENNRNTYIFEIPLNP